MLVRKSAARLALEECLKCGPATGEQVMAFITPRISPTTAVRRRRVQATGRYPATLSHEVGIGRRLIARTAINNAIKDGVVVCNEDGLLALAQTAVTS